jgi:hypothetical protein
MSKPKPKPEPTPPTPPPSSKAWENVVGEPEPAAVAAAVDPIKPPCPDTDPELGDLTPAYVGWFKDNHEAEEYIRKYAGRMEIAERQRGGVA